MTRDPTFMGALIALVLLGTPLSFSRNAAFKRRYFRPYLILVGIVFLGFLAADWGVVWGAGVGVPIVGSLTYFNARNVSFCDCGATTWGQVFRLDRERCRKCGALLPEYR